MDEKRPSRSSRVSSFKAIALSPRRWTRDRPLREVVGGPPQLPHEIFIRIAVHLRCLEGGGAIDGHPVFSFSASGGDLEYTGIEPADRAFLRSQLKRSRSYFERVCAGLSPWPSFHLVEARERNDLLKARGRDLLSLCLTSKEWSDAAGPSLRECSRQFVDVRSFLYDPIPRTRLQRAVAWPSILGFFITFIAQGPVGVAAVAAYRGQAVSAQIYASATVAGALVLAFWTLPIWLVVVIYSFTDFDYFETLPEWAGWSMYFVWTLVAIVASTSIATAAFSFQHVIVPFIAASALLVAAESLILAFACILGTVRESGDLYDLLIIPIASIPQSGLIIASAAVFSRVCINLGAQRKPYR